MASFLHNLSDYDIHSVPDATGMRVGIVVSEWNDKITGALLDGACQTLIKHGVREEDIKIKPVPGSFELVYGASRLVNSGLVDVVIAIGCVIRGDTPHFEYICQGTTQGTRIFLYSTTYFREFSLISVSIFVSKSIFSFFS